MHIVRLPTIINCPTLVKQLQPAESPVTNNEFHRVIIGNIIIALFVGRGSSHSSNRDLNIVGYTMPDKCKYSEKDFGIGCVSYGDMLTIGYPTEVGNKKIGLECLSYL